MNTKDSITIGVKRFTGIPSAIYRLELCHKWIVLIKFKYERLP